MARCVLYCSVSARRPGRRWCSVRPARHAQGLFLTLSHALTSIAVSCKRAQALDVHFLSAVLRETPAKLELSYRQSTQARAYAFPEQAAPVTTYEDVLAGKLLPCPEPPGSSFVTSPPRYSAAAGLLLSKIAKRCSHGLWSGRSAMRHSFACACCAYAIPF